MTEKPPTLKSAIRDISIKALDDANKEPSLDETIEIMKKALIQIVALTLAVK